MPNRFTMGVCESKSDCYFRHFDSEKSLLWAIDHLINECAASGRYVTFAKDYFDVTPADESEVVVRVNCLDKTLCPVSAGGDWEAFDKHRKRVAERCKAVSVHLSCPIVSDDFSEVYKICNLQIKVNLDKVADLRSPGPSKEYMANEFAEAARQAFMEADMMPVEGERLKKRKISITPAGDDGFGWVEFRDDMPAAFREWTSRMSDEAPKDD